MSKFMRIMMEVMIFVSIIGVIASAIAMHISGNTSLSNVSGASAVIIGLTTLLIVIGFVVYILKASGIKSGR